MYDSKKTGCLTELECAAIFIRAGIAVSIPYGDSEPYDMVIDVAGKLFRVQCKKASTEDNIKFSFSTRQPSTKKKYSEKDIDYYATILNGLLCMVPVSEVGSKKKTLRAAIPDSADENSVSLIKDYTLEKFLNKQGLHLTKNKSIVELSNEVS